MELIVRPPVYHEPGAFGRRDHPDLRQKMADRSVLQDLQIISQTGQ